MDDLFRDIKNLKCQTAYNSRSLKKVINSVGQPDGVATLDGSGKVPSTQLPSYVDDAIEGYFNTGDSKFYIEDTYVTEILGETGKLYISLDTNKLYRWSGSAFVYITSGAVDSVNGETGLVDLKHYTCDDLVTLTNLLSEKTGNILIDLTKNIDLPATTTTFTINENLENIWIRNYDFKISHLGGPQIIFSASNNCTISILSGMSLSGMGGCDIQLDSVGFSMILRLRRFSSYTSSFTKTVGTTGTVLIEYASGYKLPNGETLDSFDLKSTWLNPGIESKLLAESTEELTTIGNASKFFFSLTGLKQITWGNIKTILNSLYQSVLVSGTNIKTINSESILGAGNIDLVKGPASSTVNEVSIYSATDGKNVKTSGKIIVSNRTDLKTALALTTPYKIEVTKDITISGTVTVGAFHVIEGSILTFADGIIFSSTSTTGLIIDANCNFLGDAVYTSDYNTDIYIRLLTGTPNFTKTTTGELNLRITSVEKNSSITSTAGTITYEDENYFASYEKKPTFTTAFTSAIYDNGNSGTSITLDPANGQSQKLTLTGTCAITLAAVTGSVRLSLKVVQDATGGRDVTFTNTINNPQEFDFTIGTANQKCILTFFYDGEEWWYAASEWID